MQYALIREAELKVCSFYWIDVADKVSYTNVGSSKLLAVSFRTMQPVNGSLVTMCCDLVLAVSRNRIKRIIVNLAARNGGNVFIQQLRHLPGHSCLGLSSQSEKQNIVLAEKRSFYIRDYAVFITHNSRKTGFLRLQFGDEILSELFFYRSRFISRGLQFTQCLYFSCICFHSQRNLLIH